MNDFKWRHFTGEIILHCVRWYCKYGISYRDLQEMMEERGIGVDHTTLYRWVQIYATEIEKRLRGHRQGGDLDGSWRVDETYVKVKGVTHHVHILEMNGESFRLAASKKAQRRSGHGQNAGPGASNEGKPITEI